MHCVDAKTGQALWVAPKVIQFAAASGQRVYGIDDLRGLVVLDAKTGALLDRMPTDGTANALVNDQTDRLYLVSSGGLLQCLHEIGAKKPLYHNPEPVVPPKPEPGTEPSAETTRESALPSAEPPATPAEPGDDPFGGLNESGAGEGAEQPERPPAGGGNSGVSDDNPFGE